VNRKVRAALEARLHPIVCVGETLQEREANRTWEVVSRQVRAAFVDMGSEQIGRCTLAYEPVWAIGTGKTATTRRRRRCTADRACSATSRAPGRRGRRINTADR